MILTSHPRAPSSPRLGLPTGPGLCPEMVRLTRVVAHTRVSLRQLFLLSMGIVPGLVQRMNTKTSMKLCPFQQSTMIEFPSEVLLQFFFHLPRSDWKSIRRLSKAWSVTAAKHVFDEIRVGPSDRAISSLRALSNHKHLREIPSRLRVEAKLVESNLSIHKFF